MNQKIAILTDSSSAIYSYPHSYKNLFMIDLPCFLGEVMFTDFAHNQNDQFFQALEGATDIPKTSQPSVGEMLVQYEAIRDAGYTHIIFLPISRELSGTYQNAHLAKEIVKGIEVIIIDTLTTTSILLEMSLFAAKWSNEGKTVEEIVTQIEDLKTRWGYYVTVSDLTALVKNGRLSNAKSFIANLFHIKPIIRFTKEGKLVGLQNVRTFKRALKVVVDLLKQEASPTAKIHLVYAKESPEVRFAYDLLQDSFPHQPIYKYSLPATIVAHVGLGAIGIGYLDTSLS
ncbi:MAG: DegV family protein [Bacilli bacterium]|nr:DegV family protein [Bacilli bacterium]